MFWIHPIIMLPSSTENQVVVFSSNSWGKIVGGVLGFFLGGVWGALFGLIVGHLYDKQKSSGDFSSSAIWENYKEFSAYVEQATFTMGVVVLSAKMARSDGRVTSAEIAAFKRVFNISPAQEASIAHLFNRARFSADGFEPYAVRMANVFHSNPHVLEEVLSGLFIIGAADSEGLSPSEVAFLKKVSFLFGLNPEDFARIAARSGIELPSSEIPRRPVPESYVILGIEETATVEEIKTAYRALIREHHPDKLMAQGVPPEFIATATEKMKRINVAYDTLCKERGIK
jgi:DnaJ like chaperone protein